MDMQITYYVIAGILILAGLAGTILPALPGLPLVFAGMLLAAWAGNFQDISGWTVGALALLTVLSVIVEVAASALGAKRVGASKLAIIGAAVGTLLGGIFFSIPGLILGPFIGAVAGELIHGKELAADASRLGHVSRIGVGTWVGLIFGTALKIALAFAMLGIFVIALLWK